MDNYDVESTSGKVIGTIPLSTTKARDARHVRYYTEFGVTPSATRAPHFTSFVATDALIPQDTSKYEDIAYFTHPDMMTHPMLDELSRFHEVHEQVVADIASNSSSFSADALLDVPVHVVEYGLSDHELLATFGKDKTLALYDAYTKSYADSMIFEPSVHLTYRREQLDAMSQDDVTAFIEAGYAEAFDPEQAITFDVAGQGDVGVDRYVSVGADHQRHLCVKQSDKDAYVQGGHVALSVVDTSSMVMTPVSVSMDEATRDVVMRQGVRSSVTAMSMYLRDDVMSPSPHVYPTLPDVREQEVIATNPPLLTRQCASVVEHHQTRFIPQGESIHQMFMNEVVMEQAFVPKQSFDHGALLQVIPDVSRRDNGARIHGELLPNHTFKPYTLSVAELNLLRIANYQEPFTEDVLQASAPVYDADGTCIKKGKPLLTEPLMALVPLHAQHTNEQQVTGHRMDVSHFEPTSMSRDGAIALNQLQKARVLFPHKNAASPSSMLNQETYKNTPFTHVVNKPASSLKPELTGESRNTASRTRQVDDGLSL